ncbi:MAG: YggT family protein [Clostridia bacterium]|nr:YggT family protein [Clostridia bacterium]MBQ4602522.1 YggT family protein [Clostridia bacterium]
MGYIVGSLLGTVIDILLVIMLISAVMSWIAPMMDHPVMNFINGITDVLVRPMRKLLMRFEFVRSFPLDISFYLTSVILVLLRSLFRSL